MPQAASIGQTIPHDSARGHVTGTAAYLADLTRRADELVVSFVPSPVASGRLEAIELAAARKVPGIVAILTAADIPGEKRFGPLFRDEPFLAEQEVLYVGQPVVILAGHTAAAVAEARRRTVLKIVETEPILSIERALELERFIGPARRISRGDAAGALQSAPHRLSGVLQIGGQEHFYLEAQAALAYPGENGEMFVHSSTQNPTEVQHVVAEALHLAQHQVVCMCRRMGGAFGGKETQASIPAVMAALVAHHTGRAARLVYEREDDMISTGKRHPYRAEWDVGFDDAGQLLSYRVQFYSDGGAAADLSTSVMERSMLHAENAYYLPNVDIRGRVCFTNHAPTTAFRGFGGPQALATMEHVVHEVAHYLRGRDSSSDNGHSSAPGISYRVRHALDVQRRNVYGDAPRNTTPYGQLVVRNHLPAIIEQLATSAEYERRRQDIEAHNRSSRLTLRGIALAPVKFGISFTTRFLNQANALVNVFTDGSIQVSTGGTEMGQGLNTKLRQLVAAAFALTPADVIVMPTSTEKNHNTSPTAASAGTDLNGAAALDACRQIRERMADWAARRLASLDDGLTESPDHVEFADGWVFDRRRPERRIKFSELCAAARRDRVDLGARGFYATPGVDYNRETGRGNPFFYFTQGAAVAEVLIDRFTGQLSVTRVDVLMDIGRSINPGVDFGQIVGGFVQGMGWVTAECLVYDERGRLLSRSPTTYKIPAATDVPSDFRVTLFDNDDNVENVARSKAVGEPPLMHAVAVWTAVKHALGCWSPQAASELRLPATGEEILRVLTAAQGAAAVTPIQRAASIAT